MAKKKNDKAAPPPSKQRSIALPNEVDAAVEVMAKLDDRSFNSLVTKICRDYVRLHKDLSGYKDPPGFESK